jgi:LacI family transcriptional regulator
MTIADIARAAGVSTATVSRVINRGPVSDETRVRVEEAIARLDYTPNALARGLMNKSSRAIGVLTTSMSNQYYMEIAETVERRFREWGFMLFLGCTEGDQAAERRYLTDLVARQVDGVIVLDPANENFESGFLKQVSRRLPLVLVHSIPTLDDIDSVVIDQTVGMARVMDHLLGLGHREVAFLRGRHGFSYDLKESAWRQALAGAGLGAGAPLVVEDGNTEAAIALTRDALVRQFEAGSAFTALFACNDLMAMGALEAAKQVGLRVPQDLSVVGHDNTLLAVHSGLTSVDLQMRAVGTAAAELLNRAVNHSVVTSHRVLVTPELVVRESTARPSGSTMDQQETNR